MPCCILFPAFDRNPYFSTRVPTLPSSIARAPALNDVYPQSLSGFKFSLIGRLILEEEDEPLTTNELCDGLQSSWNPTSTWRLISLGNAYYSLQFSCLKDHIKVAAMGSSSLARGRMVIFSKWAAPGFDDCKELTTGPSVTFVRWRPPPPSWMKVNTDGSARGCPGPSSCGGVFRDYRGAVVGCFSRKLEEGIAFEAELCACITALDIACVQGWNKIWLESDSTEVVEALARRSTAVPEKLKASWMRVLGYLKHMEFRVSHIYREGNRVADALAGPDAESAWWPCATPAIAELVHQDAIGCFNTRVRT